MTGTNDNFLLNAKQCAAKFGIPHNIFLGLSRDGKIPRVAFGKKTIMYRPSEIEAYIVSCSSFDGSPAAATRAKAAAAELQAAKDARKAKAEQEVEAEKAAKTAAKAGI